MDSVCKVPYMLLILFALHLITVKPQNLQQRKKRYQKFCTPYGKTFIPQLSTMNKDLPSFLIIGIFPMFSDDYFIN